jgi:hypothetical protein
MIGLPILLFVTFFLLERRARRGEDAAENRTPPDEAA